MKMIEEVKQELKKYVVFVRGGKDEITRVLFVPSYFILPEKPK